MSKHAIAEALASLKSRCTGAVLTANSTGYDEARRVWNAMIDRRPALVARCETTDDVVACIDIARTHDLLASVRGGGHNVSGSAVCDDGLMIDLSPMNGVRVQPDDTRVTVQGGALWRDVDTQTQAHGRFTPGGIVSNTGVGGLTLGGGIGWMRGRYGLSIDNLLGVEIVTADGEIRYANHQDNPELYWGVRGGGGNFGVVTAFEFRSHELRTPLLYCAASYALEHAEIVVQKWRDYMALAPEELSSIIEFSSVSEDAVAFPATARGRRCVSIYAIFAGQPNQAEDAMHALRSMPHRLADVSTNVSYCTLQTQYDDLIPSGAFQCYWKCLYLNELTDTTIAEIARYARAMPSPQSECSIWDLRGAVTRVPSSATAFGDRNMRYMLSLDSAWQDPKDSARNIDSTQAFWQSMQSHSHGRLYVNFAGLAENSPELVRGAYGTNYNRLVRLKNRYDPDNLFRMNLNIEPDGTLGIGPR